MTKRLLYCGWDFDTCVSTKYWEWAKDPQYLHSGRNMRNMFPMQYGERYPFPESWLMLWPQWNAFQTRRIVVVHLLDSICMRQVLNLKFPISLKRDVVFWNFQHWYLKKYSFLYNLIHFENSNMKQLLFEPVHLENSLREFRNWKQFWFKI